MLGLNLLMTLKKLSCLDLNPAAFVPINDKFTLLTLDFLLFFFPYPLFVLFCFISSGCLNFPGIAKGFVGIYLEGFASMGLPFARGLSFVASSSLKKGLLHSHLDEKTCILA